MLQAGNFLLNPDLLFQFRESRIQPIQLGGFGLGRHIAKDRGLLFFGKVELSFHKSGQSGSTMHPRVALRT